MTKFKDFLSELEMQIRHLDEQIAKQHEARGLATQNIIAMRERQDQLRDVIKTLKEISSS